MLNQMQVAKRNDSSDKVSGNAPCYGTSNESHFHSKDNIAAGESSQNVRVGMNNNYRSAKLIKKLVP